MFAEAVACVYVRVYMPPVGAFSNAISTVLLFFRCSGLTPKLGDLQLLYRLAQTKQLGVPSVVGRRY